MGDNHKIRNVKWVIEMSEINNVEKLEQLREQALKYLGKGIKKKRFRRLKKWKVINRYLYGLMFAEDIKVSDMAEFVGVTPRTVGRWIYEGSIPNEENIDKVCEVLRAPSNVLFNEAEINHRKQTYYSESE